MYIDPNTGGILFQVLAGLLATISGVLFFFSRRIREGIARARRKIRGSEEEKE
jgi:LPXTG-motif cell wall-anchored protein